jgi:glutamine synthetase
MLEQAPVANAAGRGQYVLRTVEERGVRFVRLWFVDVLGMLKSLAIPVSELETAPELSASQHEIDLLHTDALSMADAITTFRICVKEVARELGVQATFMPKPSQQLAGSGMHLHLSLFDSVGNAFHSEDPDEPLSEVGRSFLAGVLAHAAELTAVTNQWVNSYKRLACGFEAPQRVDWARQGADSLVRVPSNRPDRETAARIELRSPDPGCNPYLAFALLLAAGLHGIERGYELTAETDDAPPAGCRRLPEDLREAIDLFESSQLARDTLGDVMCDWIVRNKRAEWSEHRRTVTELERSRLLRVL